MSCCRASQKREQEAREPDRGRLFPLELENFRVEFGTGEKRQDNRADPREKLDPGFVGSEHCRAESQAEDQLSDCSDGDFGQCRRNAQADGEKGRHHGQTQPQCCECPYTGHVFLSCQLRGRSSIVHGRARRASRTVRRIKTILAGYESVRTNSENRTAWKINEKTPARCCCTAGVISLVGDFGEPHPRFSMIDSNRESTDSKTIKFFRR